MHIEIEENAVNYENSTESLIFYIVSEEVKYELMQEE